ncbi:Bug family tripartite tricarboxylate transporter substrate binding protein [Ramlibacter sp.]|uniref:Bug family tripartite tricarboxylate transporter substrate binding protein n=1 Tax=Ramlibacter sp. TaxID=1917967 RepID=UPI003D0B4D14
MSHCISRAFAASLVRLTLAGVAAVGLSTPAVAADWAPTRPVKLIVPYTPGAGADITARLIAQPLSVALGQPVIVENRGGAGGIIGTDVAAKSPPDGHTLVWGSDVAFTIHPQLTKTPYDPIKDFEPVSLVVNLPMVLVTNPQRVAANNVRELIALAKASPGKYTVASAGNGTSHHFAAEFFKQQAGVDLLHVPFKGAAEGMNSVLAGQTDMMFISPATVLPHIKANKVRPLAMSVGRRLPAIPDTPTMQEAGVANFDVGIWMGVLYPAKTPRAAIERVSAELAKIVELPEVKARIGDLGYTAGGGKPEQLGQRIQRDMDNYRKLIRDANIKLD